MGINQHYENVNVLIFSELPNGIQLDKGMV